MDVLRGLKNLIAAIVPSVLVIAQRFATDEPAFPAFIVFIAGAIIAIAVGLFLWNHTPVARLFGREPGGDDTARPPINPAAGRRRADEILGQRAR